MWQQQPMTGKQLSLRLKLANKTEIVSCSSAAVQRLHAFKEGTYYYVSQKGYVL